jgi:MORN repeat variant
MKEKLFFCLLVSQIALLTAQNSSEIKPLPIPTASKIAPDTLLHGVYYTHYLNKKVMEEIPVKKGRAHGVYKMYYPDGNLMVESTFKEGVLYGVSKTYYETGVLREESPFENGQKQGEFKEYYTSGQLMRKTIFEKNVFQNAYFYTEFNEVFLIGEQGMFRAKTRENKPIEAFLGQYFASIGELVRNNQGNVYIKLVIGTDGKARDFRLINVQNKTDLAKATQKMYKLSQNLPVFQPAKKDNVALETSVLVLVVSPPVPSLTHSTHRGSYEDSQKPLTGSQKLQSYPLEVQEFLNRNNYHYYPRTW